MRKNLVAGIAGIALMLVAASASAGGQSGTIGVGVETDLRNVGGISVNFDGGMFHAGGFLSFSDDILGGDITSFAVGGRFYYHLHSTSMSDFGVGGQLGIESIDRPDVGPGDEDELNVLIQPGFQVRMFVATNVALSGTAGLNIGAGDAEGLLLDGDLTAGFGFHYYFF